MKNEQTKHTPGPYYVAKTGNDQGLIISEATGANVAVAYDAADAPLLAAAWEMREALTRTITALEDCEAGECDEARDARTLLARIDGTAHD